MTDKRVVIPDGMLEAACDPIVIPAKRYRQSIKLPIRGKSSQTKTLNGDNLKGKTPRRVGTHIKLEMTYEGHLSFVIG